MIRVDKALVDPDLNPAPVKLTPANFQECLKSTQPNYALKTTP
jgi:hypothetical protein